MDSHLKTAGWIPTEWIYVFFSHYIWLASHSWPNWYIIKFYVGGLFVDMPVSHAVTTYLIMKYCCSTYFTFLTELAFFVILWIYMVFVYFKITFQLFCKIPYHAYDKYSWSGHEFKTLNQPSLLLKGSNNRTCLDIWQAPKVRY